MTALLNRLIDNSTKVWSPDGSWYMTFEFVEVTPELAKEFMKMNHPSQRPKKRHWISRLAKAIQRGLFESFNGQGIVFDVAGYMIDGQNRCLAIIDSGRSAVVLVVTNAPEGAINTIDYNVKRTNGDAMKFAGHKHGVELGSVALRVLVFENKSMDFDSPKNYQNDYSQVDVVKFVEDNNFAELFEKVRADVPVAKMKKLCIPMSTALTMLAIVQRNSPQLYDSMVEFWNHVVDNDEGERSATSALHRRLFNHATATRRANKIHPRVLSAICVKAWGQWINGHEVMIIGWRNTGNQSEQFPELYLE